MDCDLDVCNLGAVEREHGVFCVLHESGKENISGGRSKLIFTGTLLPGIP